MIWYDGETRHYAPFCLTLACFFKVYWEWVLQLLHYIYLHFGNTQRSTICSVVTNSVVYVIFQIPFPKITHAILAEIKVEVVSAKTWCFLSLLILRTILSKLWISTITPFCTKQSSSISFNFDPRKSCFHSLKARITGMHRNYILKYSLSCFKCLEWILPFKSLHFLAESFVQECLTPSMGFQAGLGQLLTCEMCELTSASFCWLGWEWTDWMGGHWWSYFVICQKWGGE